MHWMYAVGNAMMLFGAPISVLTELVCVDFEVSPLAVLPPAQTRSAWESLGSVPILCHSVIEVQCNSNWVLIRR